MSKYYIQTESSDTPDRCDVEVSGSEVTAIYYNSYSEGTHYTRIYDDGDGNVIITSRVQGKTRRITVPLYTLFDLESIVRCMRDSYPGFGKRPRISVGREVE
jgi:hypothetical protein